MTYKGKVKGNVIILEKGLELPEGVTVEILIPEEKNNGHKKRGKTGICGLWKDERRAEEIIEEIKEARTGFGQKVAKL